jgi:hypothetical protein
LPSDLRERFRDERSTPQQIHGAAAQCGAFTEPRPERSEDRDEQIVRRLDRGRDLVDHVWREVRRLGSFESRQLSAVGGAPSDPAVSHGSL